MDLKKRLRQREINRASQQTGSSLEVIIVGDWIVGDEIGSGAEATVYKGLHKMNGSFVAIKTFHTATVPKVHYFYHS